MEGSILITKTMRKDSGTVTVGICDEDKGELRVCDKSKNRELEENEDGLLDITYSPRVQGRLNFGKYICT